MKLLFLSHPERKIGLDFLSTSGIFCNRIDDINQIEEISKARSWINRDEVFISTNPDITVEGQTFYTDTEHIILTTTSPDLEEQLSILFEEHYHEIEEVRYVINGKGRFDIRDSNDQWIGITVEQYDLIIVPANTYHRFSLGDDSQFIHTMRLFSDVSKWKAINRAEIEKKRKASEEILMQVPPLEGAEQFLPVATVDHTTNKRSKTDENSLESDNKTDTLSPNDPTGMLVTIANFDNELSAGGSLSTSTVSHPTHTTTIASGTRSLTMHSTRPPTLAPLPSHLPTWDIKRGSCELCKRKAIAEKRKVVYGNTYCRCAACGVWLHNSKKNPCFTTYPHYG